MRARTAVPAVIAGLLLAACGPNGSHAAQPVISQRSSAEVPTTVPPDKPMAPGKEPSGSPVAPGTGGVPASGNAKAATPPGVADSTDTVVNDLEKTLADLDKSLAEVDQSSSDAAQNGD